MATNRRLVDFDGEDFYPTPSWATEALLKQEAFYPRQTILEPCCGDGAISKVFQANGLDIFSSDKFKRGFGVQKDAFAYTDEWDVIVTNPPFAIAEEIIQHFLPLYKDKMCMLLKLSFLEGATRFETLLDRKPPQTVHIFTERVTMFPKSSEGKTGGTTAYGWFIWDRSFVYQRETRIRWIPPGLKPNSRRKTSKK